MAAHQKPGIRRKLYRLFIEPNQLETQTRNRELVFNVVLVGTGGFMSLLLLLLLYSFWGLGNHYVGARLAISAVGVFYIGLIFWLSRHLHYFLSAYMLVALYAALAFGSVWQWGINLPFGILLFGLVIVLASTLLGSKQSLYAAWFATISLIFVQVAIDAKWAPAHTITTKSTFGDVVGYSVVFITLAIISWLFGRQIERSLRMAEEAEVALQHEKDMLEIRVANRTAQLKAAQIKEMQQLYQFNEVGQLSTSLLHDLANHLAVLTMEIGGLKAEQSTTVKRSQLIIAHLDNLVDAVRDRLHGRSVIHDYNLSDSISEIIEFAKYRVGDSNVQIDWQPPASKQSFKFRGDPIKFNQVVTILVNNAVDASLKRPGSPPVGITLTRTDDNIVIKVTDKGVGIPKSERKHIFKPTYTTKTSSMGIGLYLAKQIIESQFGGRLELAQHTDRTEFVITLPLPDAISEPAPELKLEAVT